MVESLLIIAGIILASFFLFDMFYQEKEKNYFVTRFLAITITSIPAFISSIEWGESEKIFFYMAFFLGIIIGFILIILWLYLFIIKKTKSKRSNGLQILSALYNGYHKFDENLQSDIVEYEQEYEKTLLSVHENLRGQLPKFIGSIYADVDNHKDFTAYSYWVMETFIMTFFSGNDARFTLRYANFEKNAMCAVLTTRDTLPNDIPLETKNLISKSLEDNEPKIYSRNEDYHFDTKCSIANGVFDDYVTYCLLEDLEKELPLMSLNLDVKGEHARKRMEVLVDTSIFLVLCQALVAYINKEKENV